MSSVPRRVLVVDDNEGSARLLAILLSRLAGHDVKEAFDGPSALAAMEEFEPEVVLLDIGLPGMSGYEVARRIRAASGGSHVLLVAVTGFGEEEDRQRSFESGFDEHLVKPAPLDALQAIFTHPKLSI